MRSCRSGHSVIRLWWVLHTLSDRALAARAASCRELAAMAHREGGSLMKIALVAQHATAQADGPAGPVGDRGLHSRAATEPERLH